MTDALPSGNASICTPTATDDCPQGAHDVSLAALLLAHQRDVTLLIDNDARINYASPSVRTLAGYAAEDVIGEEMLSFVHPDDTDLTAGGYLRFTNGHENDEPIQFRIRTADGYWLWCESRLSKMIDAPYEGFTVVNLREIEHLQRLRTHIRTGEFAVGIGSWRWGLNEAAPEWSDGLFALLGQERQPGPVDVDEAHSLWHPDDQTRLVALISEALENPHNFDTVARIRHKNGHYLIVRLYGYVEANSKGKPVALIGVVHDITSQRKAEEALRESERHYRLIVDQASDMIARFDAVGRCTFMSPGGCAILGRDPSDIIGQGPLRFVHPDDRDDIAKIYEHAQQGQDQPNVVYRAVHKDGHSVWLEASSRPIYDDEEQLREIIIIARDISERKATEDHLRAAREKAEAANRTKSRFLANMSHELRTPLNAVIGFSDIMCEEMFGELGSEKYKDYSRLIRESGHFLLDLITDILDMSKIEAGKYELYLEDIRLDAVADAALLLVHQRAKDKQLTISVDIDPELPVITADERAVKQILLNLLSNAIKFTPKNGAIALTAIQQEDMVQITVRDTGIGIAPDAVPRLARPFEQARSDAALAQAGTGLGLALVKSFVTLHGGELSIDSALGNGTAVTFTLPLNQPSSVAQTA